jgi:hypothetical protein
MPAYYASWGRYTQLAGLLILPGVFALVARLWPRLKNSPSSESTPTQPLRWVLLAALASAGLALTHYRVSAFLAVLLLAAWITYNARALWLGRLRRTLGPSLGWVLLVALLAALLTLPWWPETLSGLLAPTSSKMGAVNQRPEFFAGFAWNLLTAASGRLVLVLAGLGLALAVILRRWFWPALVLWVAGLFLLSNMATLGLPAFNLINNLSVEIALFLPLCLLGGFLVTWPLEALAGRLPAPLKPPYWLAAALASCILALYAARALLPILNPITLLFRAADRPAIGWVDQNLPEDAHLLINPFLWGYGIYAGADGGAWIPALAGRAALPPPVLYGTAANAADRDAVITASSRVLDLSQDPQGLHAHLRELGIDYVFLGERGGVLSPRILQDSPLFELRYAQDGAWVFELR